MRNFISRLKASTNAILVSIVDYLWIPEAVGFECDNPKCNIDHIPSRFDYVAYSEESQAMQQIFKAMVTDIEQELEWLKDGRAKSLALTKLEECYMWIGKAIRDDQIADNAETKLQEERCNS